MVASQWRRELREIESRGEASDQDVRRRVLRYMVDRYPKAQWEPPSGSIPSDPPVPSSRRRPPRSRQTIRHRLQSIEEAAAPCRVSRAGRDIGDRVAADLGVRFDAAVLATLEWALLRPVEAIVDWICHDSDPDEYW